MSVYRLLQLLSIGFVLAISSCQLVADIEKHDPDPLATGCVLPPVVPNSNAGKVRVANLFPSKDPIDICIRSTGTQSYGRPVFRSSGRDQNNFCGAGLAYPKVTQQFAVPLGNLDVKIIPAGKTCAVAALAESTGIFAGTDFGLTLAYMGGSSIPGSIVAMPETPLSQMGQQNRKTRFVNAVPGSSVVFGLSDTQALPTTISENATFTKGIEFGHAADSSKANGTFTLDDRGYLGAFGQIDVSVVAAYEGTSKAILLAKQSGQGILTLFAIGEPKTAFPVRGLLCHESDAPDQGKRETVCDQTVVETFSVDIFNAGLYGGAAKVEDKRAKPVLEALAQRGLERSDLLCVTEVDRHNDNSLPAEQREWTQEHLIELAMKSKDKGGYGYYVQGTSDQNTPFSEPANQNGMLPEVPTQPPCIPSVEVPPGTTIEGGYECLRTKCSTTGDGTGVTLNGAACYSKLCSGPLAGFLYGQHDQHVCFNCMIANGLSYMPWDQNRTNCTTKNERPFVFGGKPTSLMLSKYPLVDQDQYVVQTLIFRRVALFARMQYAPGEDIDVYCIAAPPLPGSQLPYSGDYGNGANEGTGEGWEQNQVFGVRSIVEWIKTKSAGRPAIIAGDWSASANALDAKGNVIAGSDGMPVVANVNAASIQLLRDAFVEAVPADDYRPQCTRCPAPENPLNKGVVAQLNLSVFIKDPWAANLTESVSRFMDSPAAIQIDNTDYGVFGPYSETFGYNVKVRIP